MTLRNLLLLGYVAVSALSLTGVLFRGAATAPGLKLGLPSGLAWVTGWSVVTFLVLWAYDATRPKISDVGEDA